MKQADVTIIVVNWNLKEKTADCLRSLQQVETPHQVIVVDNGSTDNSAEYLMQQFPYAIFLILPENVGFGVACNMAIRQALSDAHCQYIFLLNNDATIHVRTLDRLLHTAQQKADVGILGPKIYHSQRQNVLWYAGARCRRGVLAAADTGRGQVDVGQFDTRQDVDFVFGAAMLIRRSVFDEIGLFDPQFFLYLEDMDFCLRAQKAGFRLLFVPNAIVWHYGSASTAKNILFRKHHQARSTLLFLWKHASWMLLPFVFAFWLAVTMRAIALELLWGNTAVIRSYWSGFVKGLTEVVGYDQTRFR
jgi:GT2 family glycosyltransferase